MFKLINKSFKCKLSEYEKDLYNNSLLGDSLVIGVGLIQAKNCYLTHVVVKKALSIMKNRHPFLRAYLEHKNQNNDIFLISKDENESDDINLEWSIIENSKNLNYELEKFNNKLINYEEKELLWRFKVIRFNGENDRKKYALCIVIPLFLTDGINISTILVEIVNIINSILTCTECDEMITKLDLIENLHYLSSKYKLFSEVRFNENNIYNYKCFILHEKFKIYNEKGSKIDIIKIKKEQTKKIIKISKEKKCKLTGFINAVIIYSLRELYDENDLKFPTEFSCGIPANLRIRYKPNLDFSHIRNQVCLTRFNLDSTIFGQFKDIWSDSILINEQIKKCTNVEDGSIFSLTHTNKIVEHTDLILSNIGTYIKDRKKIIQGPFQIKEIYHGDSLNSTTGQIPALIFHVTSWNDELQIMLSSNRHFIGSIFIERLVSLVENYLNNCV